MSGGLHRTVETARKWGARAFAIFTGNARAWIKPTAITAEDSATEVPKTSMLHLANIERFHKACGVTAAEDNATGVAESAPSSNSVHQISYAIDKCVVVHGSYLINAGSSDPEILKKSRAMMQEEMRRCQVLGLRLYAFHPGSTSGKSTEDECLALISESINLAHENKASPDVVTLIENTAGSGHSVGNKFEHLAKIIKNVRNKQRIGVCLDTCHAFAAGYDLRTVSACEKTFSDLDTIVGMKYLRAMHLNDSKGDVACKADRHEHIGQGKIGLEAFRFIMNDARFDNIPMVLETPGGDYSREIALLYSLEKTPTQQQPQQQQQQSTSADRLENTDEG